jgi:hypothetical protein
MGVAMRLAIAFALGLCAWGCTDDECTFDNNSPPATVRDFSGSYAYVIIDQADNQGGVSDGDVLASLTLTQPLNRCSKPAPSVSAYISGLPTQPYLASANTKGGCACTINYNQEVSTATGGAALLADVVDAASAIHVVVPGAIFKRTITSPMALGRVSRGGSLLINVGPDTMPINDAYVVLDATAPGTQPYSSELTVGPGQMLTVSVPADFPPGPADMWLQLQGDLPVLVCVGVTACHASSMANLHLPVMID